MGKIYKNKNIKILILSLLCGLTCACINTSAMKMSEQNELKIDSTSTDLISEMIKTVQDCNNTIENILNNLRKINQQPDFQTVEINKPTNKENEDQPKTEEINKPNDKENEDQPKSDVNNPSGNNDKKTPGSPEE